MLAIFDIIIFICCILGICLVLILTDWSYKSQKYVKCVVYGALVIFYFVTAFAIITKYTMLGG